MRGELKIKLLEIIEEEVASEIYDEVEQVICDFEHEVQSIRDKLDDIKGIDDLHYVEDARDMADKLADKLY